MAADTRLGAVVVALLLTVSVGSAVPGVVSTVDEGVVGTATAEHGGPGNYTVGPYDDGEGSLANDEQKTDTCVDNDETPSDDKENKVGEEDCDPYNGHMPGDTGASYRQFAYGGEAAEVRLEPFQYVVHGAVAGDWNMTACEPANAGFAGIDRGNNKSGTDYDVDLTRFFKNTYEYEMRIVVDLAEGEPQPGTHINPEDQIVAGVEDCYKNPDEPGWYQWYGYSNGTGPEGETRRTELTTHYFPICNCSNESAAREQLGPPPSEQDGSATPTATPTTPTPTPNPNATPTPTLTPTPTPTATPTPTDSGDTGGSADSTPTRSGDSGDSTPTRTDSAGDDGDTPTATQAGGGGGGTPTIGSGPGFGAVAALVALVGGALLALRRR
jgi:PGF-CTERM protein